jgi:hypothetical protein
VLRRDTGLEQLALGIRKQFAEEEPRKGPLSKEPKGA